MTRRRSFDPRPLRFALWGAAIFVKLRLVYRSVFNGAGGETVLWNVPVMRLPDPLSTVTLGGPVSAEGLWAAAVSALPVAMFLVAWGALLAFVDFRRILRVLRHSVHGRAILTALGIMLSTFPSVVASVGTVRHSARLRGVRGIRAAALVVSAVVTRSVELALTTGAAMESRGFGHASNRATGMCEFPVEARRLSLFHGDRMIIGELDLSCTPGSVTLVTGDTGSGKTTLLRALAGQFQHIDGGTHTGVLHVGAVDRRATPPRDTAHFVGFVPQDPRTSFIAETVADELVISAELSGGELDAAHYRATTIATELGITHLLQRSTASLSSGEATMVAIAAALVVQPTVLILDEPLADLDDIARDTVVSAVTRITEHTHIAVVVSEHRTALLHDLATTVVRLSDGRAHIGGRELCEPTLFAEITRVPIASLRAVLGPNGVGKTTVLSRAAAVDPAIALVPERAADLLLTTTVAADCALNDRARRLPRGTTWDRICTISDGSISPQQHPHDLSTGQQLLVALAIQTAHNPEHLMVDEPTRGLDAITRGRIVELLHHNSTHRLVTIATHDTEFVSQLGAAIIPMPTRESVDERTVASAGVHA